MSNSDGVSETAIIPNNGVKASWVNDNYSENSFLAEKVVNEVKRPRGRPKKPENLAKENYTLELQKKIYELQTARNQPMEEFKELADMVRIIQRAMKGLGVEDDMFQGLIDAKDIRERTRLDETALLSHNAMITAYTRWPIFRMFEPIAKGEDHYYISEDGEGRKEGILLKQAQSKIDSNLVLNMPNTNGGIAQSEQPVQPQPQKKGNFITRMFKR